VGLYTLVGENPKDLERRYRRMQESAPGGMLDAVSLDEWRRGRLVGTVDEARQQLGAWEALGVQQFVACIGPLPFSVVDPEDVELVVRALKGGASGGSTLTGARPERTSR